MSIKDLFNNPGTPKIQKTVTSDELVETVESSDYVEAKRKEFGQFIPPIDFSDPSNFAKFGSAELYYQKAFERIHNEYPYDGTLAEKIEFENSSSYLDKYVFDNLYPRTNGYVNFDGTNFIDIDGGPHTASSGMSGKPLDETFDKSMIYEESIREGAFNFDPEKGFTIEFWMKKDNPVPSSEIQLLFEVSNRDKFGYVGPYSNIFLYINDAQELSLDYARETGDYIEFSGAVGTSIGEGWNHYALSIKSSPINGSILRSYKNGQMVDHREIPEYVERFEDINAGINATIGGLMGDTAFNSRHDLPFIGSIDEFRFWKTERSPEQIFNSWFSQVGGGTNKHDANLDLSVYYKFNEGITGNSDLDKIVLDYSGRINNGVVSGYSTAFRSTGSAITEKLGEPEFLDPIIYSSHPDVIAKKAELMTSGSLADLNSTSQFIGYFPSWMQEEDEQQGNQLKNLSQILGSYFDTLWHQIDFVDKVHDQHFISGSDKALPFAKKLLYDRGFVMPDLFVDAKITENLMGKDDNEIYEKQINEVRNIIYHNIYNNLETIYKSKGTEKSFRNFFRSAGIGQDLVKLNLYADDSTFVLRDNYEFKSLEKKFVDFNKESNFSATIYQSSSNGDYYIPGDKDYLGSLTFETELILPKKPQRGEIGHFPFPDLESSVAGFHSTGSLYDFPVSDLGMSIYVIKSTLENQIDEDSQRVKFKLSWGAGDLESPEIPYQYLNNKWNLAVRMRHSNYPYANVVGNVEDDYVLEFYGVEADGNTKRNSFSVSTAITADYFRSDKIFYAGAERTNYSGSVITNSDIRLGSVRYWHSYLSDSAIDKHAFDPETFGANEPFESDLVNTYEIEIPREKTLALHWSFNSLTGSDSLGEMNIPDLSSGSVSPVLYGSLAQTIGQINEGKAIGFNPNDSKALDKDFLHVARKRRPDDLMSSDLTTIKSEETENFFVDEDVSDNFYSFEKSMWGVISDEMLNMFSTALDLNNLIGQPNQKYHHRYNMADFLRDRFFDDVENEPDIEKFTSFYKWIDDSISIALQQLIPASARFSEKINNIIESHVLERNKYVHQFPILTNFESTEGSIKGISEMKYDWKHGHAPKNPEEEQFNVLWQKERKEKEIDSLQEILRTSRNNHSLQSSGLTRKEIDGSTRIEDAYAVRRFAKTHDFSVQMQQTIHGGTNFSRNKNLQFFHESIQPAGTIEPLGQPTNVITVGLGEGTGIIEEQRNEDNLPRKKKYNAIAEVQKQLNNEYAKNVKSDIVFPMNIMSGTVHTGYNKQVKEMYRSDVIFTNLHNDTVGISNEISMQGPFTEGHVGGLQYRHIDINKFDSNKSFQVPISTISSYPTGLLEFDTAVLSQKYSEGTGSWVRVIDADGTRMTAYYAPFYDFYDNQWSTIEELSYLISHKLDVETKIQSPTILELTQSTSGSFYNNTIITDANNYITASGFAGGLAASTSYVERNLDHRGQRPEGWGLLFKTHIRENDSDGAFGFVGADYGTPYPYPYYAKATRYREEHAKRPINVKNIKTSPETQRAGNFKSEIEIFSVASEHQKTWAIEAYNDPNIDILPPSIASTLPETTHYQTLMGFAGYVSGNYFGHTNNNRQFDGGIIVPAMAGTPADGAFKITGSTNPAITASGSFLILGTEVEGTFASGSFDVTGATIQGAFASGSFEVTGAQVLGTNATGEFTMIESYSPAASASMQFTAGGRTILGDYASGSFEVSGAYVSPAYADATFNVYGLPSGGQRSYAIFEANYQVATDGHEFNLGRNSNAYGIEVDYNGAISAGNTIVTPIIPQSASYVTGSGQFYSGSISYTHTNQFALSFWTKFPDTSLTDTNTKKYIYSTYDSSRPSDYGLEIYFDESPNQTNLIAKHHVLNDGNYLGNYKKFTWTNLGSRSDIAQWHNLVFFFYNGEGKLYLNNSLITETGSNTNLGTGTITYTGLTVDHHSFMDDSSGTTSDWGSSPTQNVEISDFILYNSSSANISDVAIRQSFVNAMYVNGGLYEPNEAAGNAALSTTLAARYKFGDTAGDSTLRDGIIYNSRDITNYNLTSSFELEDGFHDSVFSTMKTKEQYFDSIKAAIESHNSDGYYFNVYYGEFTTTATSDISSFWYNSGSYAMKAGQNLGVQIKSGDPINMATFYVVSKQESDAAFYQTSPTVYTASITNDEKKSFRKLTYDGVSSAQTNAMSSIEDTYLTIDGTRIDFNHHNNSQTGNQVLTFDNTLPFSYIPCLSGSNNDGEIKNTSYPSESTINGGNSLSISFYASYDTTVGGTQTILTMKSLTGNSTFGSLAIYMTATYVIARFYQNSTTSKQIFFQYSAHSINKEDLNHYALTFNSSTFNVEFYANGESKSTTTSGTISNFNHIFTEIWIANALSNTIYELIGKMCQLAIWDKVLSSTEVSEIYNDGRVKNLYGHSAVANLVHWYKLGTETGWPSVGSNLTSFLTIPDSTPRDTTADLTVGNGTHFTSQNGLPNNTLTDTDFWDALSSSIDSNVANFNVSYVDNSTYATFTVTYDTIGTIGNGKSLTDGSPLVYSLESTTAGGIDGGGSVDGHSITIKAKTFEVDDSNTTNTSDTFYIQNTGTSEEFWNSLSQSIKDNTNFDTINISGAGFTRTFSLTSSVRTSVLNNTLSVLGDSFSIVSQTAGGVTDTGANDGDYISLYSNGTKTITVDRDNDGTSISTNRFIYSVQATDTDWWNAIKTGLEYWNYGVSYVDNLDNTATFTVQSFEAGASGNESTTAAEFGSTFTIPSSPNNKFAGGLDTSGAEAGDQIEIDGTTFTITHTSPAGPTEILATGSGVTDSVMWAEMQTKIAAQTGFTATTGSDNPRTFNLTSKVIGSSENPNISKIGSTFTIVDAGTSGTDESGAEHGDIITIEGQQFWINTLFGIGTGSNADFHNALSQSIKDITSFDTITITDLGTGYHRFDLTSSVAGTAKNVPFTQNLNGSRATFKNLNGASGGVDEFGAEGGDILYISSEAFTIVNGVPGIGQVSSTGSTTDFHNSLSQSIKDSTVFDTINIVDLGNGYHRFNLTSSLTGSDYNVSITQSSNGSRATFVNLVDTAGGTLETGAEAGDSITIDGSTFTIVDGAPANSLEISTTGSDSDFHNALSQSIKNYTNFDTITITDLGGYHRFDLTSSAVGALGNAAVTANNTPGVRTTFSNVSNITNGVNASGIVDGDELTIGSLTFVLTESSPGDLSDTFYVETTGTSTQIWASLESKIESNGYSATITNNGDYALFSLVSTLTGLDQNVAMSGDSPSFFDVDVTLLNGQDSIPAVLSAVDNVIQIPRTDLTGSKRNISTRFSAPGGPEIQTYGYLDAYTSTYSVHNALPWRNLSVLGSGSGEEGTIRVEDHLGLRRGLSTLRTLHSGKFGIDSQYGEITSNDYLLSGSYNKQHRNTSHRLKWNDSSDEGLSGTELITGSAYDNMHINTPIPRSELQYSWINAAIAGDDAPQQNILGYAPRDGIVSSSLGFVDAIVFPSASSIFAS